MDGQVDVMKRLVGKELPFYGVCAQCFKLGDAVYEAREDPDDSYRSYLDSIEVVELDDALTFPQHATARVCVKERESESAEFEGFELVDVTTGHVWLRVGTDNGDDYYPYFVFEYAIPGTEN